MLRPSMLLFVASVLSLTPAAGALSQNTPQLSITRQMHATPSDGTRPDSVQYDHRALRFESHRWGIRILEGNEERVVGKTQWFRSFDLASIVASSNRALSEAQDFNKYRTPGMWALTLGIVAVAADAVMVRANGNPNFVTSTVGIVGTVLIVSGAERLDRASEALSRSLWWYNRDLSK